MRKVISTLSMLAVAVQLPFVCFGTVNAQTKPVAYWTFDSIAGNTYFDVSGNGHDAVASGSYIKIITDGLCGKALQCRGQANDNTLNTYDVKVKNSLPDFNLTTFSVEAWAYSYVYMNNPGSFFNQRAIFEHISCCPGIVGGYSLKILDNGHPFFCWGSPTKGSWDYVISDSMMLPHKWYHFVVTWDDTKVVFYINNRVAAQKSRSEMYILPTKPARIGCEWYYNSSDTSVGVTRQFFNGLIDELQLYNYALDNLTIQQHYAAYKPIAERPFKINFGMKHHYCDRNDTAWVPIYLSNYEDWNFCNCRFSIKIDTSKIELLSLDKDSGMVKNWSFTYDQTRPDSVIVTCAGTGDTVKYGEGEFLRCKYRVKPAVLEGDTCSIDVKDIDVDETYHLISALSVPGKVIIYQPSILYGDIDGDGCVTVSDARTILSGVTGTIDSVHYPHFTHTVADVSGDGCISSYDAALVSQYSAGMLPDLPVMKSTSLRKNVALRKTGTTAISTLSLALVSQSSTGGTKYSITGDNLKGFVAGEFIVSYNSAIAIFDTAQVETPLRGAVITSGIDKTNELLTIALATNDDITNSDSVVVLATITIPPSASILDPSNVFTIASAYLNEGNIPSNVPSGGITSTLPRKNMNKVSILKNVTYCNHRLNISSNAQSVRVQIYALNGRIIENRYYTTGIVSINTGRYPQSVYIYRVLFGNAEVKTGKFISGK